MIIVDSNIWIAWLHVGDSQHARAQKIMDRFISLGGVAITEYVILEVSTVLTAKAGKRVVDIFLEIVRDNRDIRIITSDEHFFQSVVALFLENRRKNLSFVDISLLYLSDTYEVVTFDKNLEKAILSRS